MDICCLLVPQQQQQWLDVMDGRTDARQFHRPRYSLHLLTYLSREWYKQLTGSSGCM